MSEQLARPIALIGGEAHRAEARCHELRTERLTLRPLAPSDCSEFLRVIGGSRRWLDEYCPLSNRDDPEGPRAESAEEIFARQLGLSDAAVRTERAWRTVGFDADGRMVGAFNINDIVRGLEHTGELVFWLSADATRRGYAEEALRATVAHAFADLPEGLGLHKLSALIAPGNSACLRLVRKLGMELDMGAAPTILRLAGRPVVHSMYHVYASVGTSAAPQGGEHVVEAKPSVAEELFGRGLLSILRTEGHMTS